MTLENPFLRRHLYCLMDWNSLSLSEVVNERIFNQDIPSMFTQSSVLLSSIKKIVFFLLDIIDFLNLFLFIFFQEKNLEIIKKATSPVIQSVFLVFWILRI